MATIETVTDLQFSDAEGAGVNMTVKFAELPAPVPFHAVPDDPVEHGRKLYADALAGVYGPIADYVPPAE